MDHIKNAAMGCLFTKMLSWLSLGKGTSSLPAPLPVGVLLCGLSRSGKSSVLYRLKLGSFIPTMATLGVVQEQVDLQQAAPPPGSAPRTWRMQVFDVGRPDLARGGQCWQQYIKFTDCVIFVVDATDRRRLSEARGALLELMFEERFQTRGTRFLVFANKQVSE
eukprot:GHVU01034205.1.p1 GENE.GHVU01034205.1~~GHVU01034205.1.p1  ORF type:complete len:164 (+),score=20.35 GHVU01034205.1:106-597(+)